MESTQNKAKPPTQTPLKILIADDDAPTRILLRAAVSQWGYQTIVAKDGEEAWELMKQEDAPRLLILDWLMPKLDGIALCERSKKELKYNTYIILLTQVAGTTNIVKGLEAGADEFLTKPFNMAELRSRLQIGARIINYEAQVDEKNKQLHNFIAETKRMLEQALENSQQLSDSLNKESADANKITPQDLNKIQEIHKSLENIIEVSRKFELDSIT